LELEIFAFVNVTAGGTDTWTYCGCGARFVDPAMYEGNSTRMDDNEEIGGEYYDHVLELLCEPTLTEPLPPTLSKPLSPTIHPPWAINSAQYWVSLRQKIADRGVKPDHALANYAWREVLTMKNNGQIRLSSRAKRKKHLNKSKAAKLKPRHERRKHFVKKKGDVSVMLSASGGFNGLDSVVDDDVGSPFRMERRNGT
jgi:hypothetical protein